jgi:thiol-disulfide isomerase/thioredoxin
VTLNFGPNRRLTQNPDVDTRILLLLAIAATQALTGCGPAEPKEVSAETSGYLPSDKTKNSTPAKVQKPAEAIPIADQVDPSRLSIAPEVPTYEPGKLDPQIAAKEYMKLKLGELKDSASLVQFLEKSTRAMRELMADGRSKRLPIDVLLDRGMELSRMKVQAADMLAKLAVTADEKVAATLGKLESLETMASFGDVAASDDLRVLAEQESGSTDPRVAEIAKSILLNLSNRDYENGTAKADDVFRNAELVLTSATTLNPSILTAVAQAIENLDRHDEKDLALQLAKKVEEAFRNHDKPQLALSAWQIHAQRTTEMKDIVGLIQPDPSTPIDPAQAKETINALMNKIPSPWTSFFLVQAAIQLEYSDQPLIAKEMIDVAQTQIDNVKNVDARAELALNCEQFQKRLGIINKPLDLSALVDTEGKPIDMERYKGKVVLVDFWATWCGPCIQEIPNIEKVFSAKNKDGFEVISINLDENREKLATFLKSREPLWKTYVSNSDKPDERGFQTAVAKAIGISAIPFIAILGKDGNVAGIHVRGPKIESKVAELLAL